MILRVIIHAPKSSGGWVRSYMYICIFRKYRDVEPIQWSVFIGVLSSETPGKIQDMSSDKWCSMIVPSITQFDACISPVDNRNNPSIHAYTVKLPT